MTFFYFLTIQKYELRSRHVRQKPDFKEKVFFVNFY